MFTIEWVLKYFLEWGWTETCSPATVVALSGGEELSYQDHNLV